MVLEKDVKDAAALAKITRTVSQIRLDVTDQRSIESAATDVETESGGLDILVHNAGILGTRGLMVDKCFVSPNSLSLKPKRWYS